MRRCIEYLHAKDACVVELLIGMLESPRPKQSCNLMCYGVGLLASISRLFVLKIFLVQVEKSRQLKVV